jgi:hypothetical protein
MTLFRGALATEQKLSILSTPASVSRACEFRYGLFLNSETLARASAGEVSCLKGCGIIGTFSVVRSWTLLSEHAYFLLFEHGSASYACPWRTA